MSRRLKKMNWMFKNFSHLLFQDPTCAKLTISGFLGPVPEEEVPSAEEIMFSRHPAMAKWPAGHQFQLWERFLTYLIWH